MTCILAVHAHPDDLELLAGGTLALLSARGCEVVMVTATAGEGGSAEYPSDETGRLRQAEAAAAAALIGADYRCLGFPDLGVFNDDASRRTVTELLRAVRPDIVLTGSPVDYHPDHEAVSQLVRDACFAAPVMNYRTGPSRELDGIPHLYFADAIGGRDRSGQWLKPDFVIDVGTTFATKRAMLAEHRSQAAWVAKQHGVTDQLGDLERWTRRVARDFPAEFAEGFRQYRHEPYPKTPALQDLLADVLLTP
jgi:LmbE family N-acetylglucosaminyl deacetylase